MGTRLGPLVEGSAREVKVRSLRGSALAVDALNRIYALWEGALKAGDGSPGDRASLSLLSGAVGMLEAGITPVYIFDSGIEGSGSPIARAVKVCYKALQLSGIPALEAPGEGEAQASRMCARGAVWGVLSRDYDCLLFGAKRVVSPFPGYSKNDRVGLLELRKVLEDLTLTRRQLVDLALLMGTDAFPGAKGVGPKRSLSLIRRHGTADGAIEDGADLPLEALERGRMYYLEPAVEDGHGHPELTAPDYTGLERLWGGLSGSLRRRRERVLSGIKRVDRTGEQRGMDAFF